MLEQSLIVKGRVAVFRVVVVVGAERGEGGEQEMVPATRFALLHRRKGQWDSGRDPNPLSGRFVTLRRGNYPRNPYTDIYSDIFHMQPHL